MPGPKHIPIYSIDEFSASDDKQRDFQVEVFDAHRHFRVEYPHRHDFYEVLYLSGGSGYHIIDSNRYAIAPPCVFFMTPGQTHKLELSHDIVGYIFLFSSGFYLINHGDKNRLLDFPFFHSVTRQNPPLLLNNSVDNAFISGLLERGCQLMKEQPSPRELIRSLLETILLTCSHLYPNTPGNLPNKKGHLLVKRLMQLIEENYHRNLKVSEYARMLAISPNHLTQIVKQITGKSTLEVLQEKNILEIKRLLLFTSLTITEISLKMNFADQSYFTKYFKKCTGKTPLEYRTSQAKQE